MSKFSRNLLLFLTYFSSITIIILASLMCIYHVTFKDIPPPNLSNSFSLNDKLHMVRNKKSNVIAIGSSITLNDLNSDVVVKNLKDTSFLNISSWGLAMKDIYKLLKSYSMVHIPRILIVSSNMSDFYIEPKNFNYIDVGHYLNSKNTFLYHVKNFNLKYYVMNSYNNKKYKESKHIYESLIYDKYGSVMLDPDHFRIDSARWRVAFINEPVQMNYDYLDSISDFCKKEKIKLIFLQAPVRKKLFKQMDTTIFERHIKKVETILAKNNVAFVNSTLVDWEDTLYVDAIHFNSNGAKLYTQYCFDMLARQNKSFP